MHGLYVTEAKVDVICVLCFKSSAHDQFVNWVYIPSSKE